MIEIPERWSIHEGDALALLTRLPTGCVDVLCADHPYSSGGMVRGDRMQGTAAKYMQSDSGNRDRLVEFSGDTRDQRAYAYWCALWLSEALRATKPGGVGMLFCDWRQLGATQDAFQAGGWAMRGVLPWIKPDARPQAGRFTQAAEFVVWGSNGPMPIVQGAPCLPGWHLGSAPRDRDHITQKPVALMTDLLAIAPDGGVVLDPFAGSGTTGVAAVSLGLRFIGFELVPHHAGTARDKIGRAAGERVDKADQLALV